MKKLNLFIILLSLTLASPAFSKEDKESTALSQLQILIRDFVSQYRLKVDMEKVYLDFSEKFYHKKKKKSKLATKTFKEQALKMKITFEHQDDRLVPMRTEALAGRLDQEVIQKFCRKQNLKSKNVRIMVLDDEDYRNPSQESPLPETVSNIGFKITAKCVARSKKSRR